MNHTRRSLITLTTLALLVSLQATAELRTWTDSRGNTIEAELIENMHGEITLQKVDGKESHIDISDLSANDQKYVLKNSPPKIDISVSAVTDRKNKGFSFEDPNDSNYDRDVQVQTSTTFYKATLKRSGSIPYDRPIQAELYVIGFKKQAEEFVVLSKTIKTFTFGQGEVEDEFVFTSDPITTKNLQGGREKGIEYHGNLLVLVDDKGHVFSAKGSRSKMEEHAAFIRKQSAGATVKKTDLASAINQSK